MNRIPSSTSKSTPQPSNLRCVQLNLVIAAVLLFAAGATNASDGVIEINQARAEAGGVSAGDTAGFPVSILEPGSYRLTSDLVVASTTQDAVRIETVNVTLDLNGFSIIGPVSCTGNPAVCPLASTGYGVRVIGQGGAPAADSNAMVKIKNGKIRGVGGQGIQCNNECFVEDMEVKESASNGLNVGRGYVRRVNVHRNGGIGILSTASAISDCQATNNGEVGIRSVSGHIQDSFASNNGEYGFESILGSVTDSVSRGNVDEGLFCSTCVYGGNVLVGNGTEVSGTNRTQLGENICGSAPCS